MPACARFGQYPHMQDVVLSSGRSSARPTSATPSRGGPVRSGRDHHRRLAGARGRTRRARGSTSASRCATCGCTRAPRPCSPRTPSCTRPIARRQNELRRLQDLYRVRLATPRRPRASCCSPTTTRSAQGAALRDRRSARLDAEHLRAIRAHPRTLRDARLGVRTTPMLARQLAELEHLIERRRRLHRRRPRRRAAQSPAAVRPRAAAARTPVAAWSAGAMAIAERVVLFHDHPPQGAGNAEVFEAGLGLVRGAVFLPHAATRLALDDVGRVALLARRLPPAACSRSTTAACCTGVATARRARGSSSRLQRTGRHRRPGHAHERTPGQRREPRGARVAVAALAAARDRRSSIRAASRSSITAPRTR